MESKEVLAHVKELSKAREDDGSVLATLRALERGVVPSERLLRETRVGVEVNRFKKSSNPEVSLQVRRMITAWKDAINKQKKARASEVAAASTPTSGSHARSGSNSSAVTGAPNGASKHEPYHNDKPRNAKNDGVDTNLHNHKLRDQVIRALYDALANGSEHPPSSILHTVKYIEAAMNEHWPCDTHEREYKNKYRVIYSNVISKNNPDLKVKIANGDLTPEYLVTCDAKDLAPEHLKEKLKEIAAKNLYNAQGPTIERSVTDRFTCGKCKEKKVSYYQLQTRSADEPLTTFCTCEACGNRWKFS